MDLRQEIESFPGGASAKNLPANAGDIRHVGSIPGSGRSPGGRHGNPLQYSCLESPMDSGAWWAGVQRVTKSRTRLSDLACTHIGSRESQGTKGWAGVRADISSSGSQTQKPSTLPARHDFSFRRKSCHSHPLCCWLLGPVVNRVLTLLLHSLTSLPES